MSEPERLEYEGGVVRHLRRTLIEGDLQVTHLGRPARFEDVESEASSVVVAFRSTEHPNCLFGRREDAIGPYGPRQDPQRDAPEGWAEIVWISLMENLATGLALPKECDPGSTIWV